MHIELNHLTKLKQEWLTLQPMLPERHAILWRKLRLEWNYHSNHIEGNTLTYGETELLLLHDRTTGNHHHREYLEMKAHDVGIGHVAALAADPTRVITEADIRDLNKIILKEPFWKAAETRDGQATRKEIIPGQYKTSPNNVRLANGEIFFFASVEDTPPKMQALAKWLKTELDFPGLHPVELAARLHHAFVLIHPFDDGNGRVARLLVNYVLMRSGYLPVIVRTGDKVNYLTALQLADAGDLRPLTDYLANLTEWSLHLGIKAAKGEPIHEPSDVEKEVALFVRDQTNRKAGNYQVTAETVQQLFDLSLKPFLLQVEARMLQLVPLFHAYEVQLRTEGSTDQVSNKIPFSENVRLIPGGMARVTFLFFGYQGEAATPFDFGWGVELHFPRDHYTIASNGVILASKAYSEPVSGEESDQLSAAILAQAFSQIKKIGAKNSPPPAG